MGVSANLLQTVNISTSIGGYGYMYNWYAVNTANFAPSGWHVPTLTEWNTLVSFVGTNPATKLKEIGLTHWLSGIDGTDDFGFSAIGGGYRSGSSGSFQGLKYSGRYCTITPTGIQYYVRELEYNLTPVYTNNRLKSEGHSVRLIKDNSTNPNTLTDYDGNVYDTIDINGQIWTKQNWKCTRLNDGTSLTKVTVNGTWAALTTEGYCSYNNDDNNV